VTMHYGDVVNLVNVTGTNADVGVNRVAEFVAANGVDFLYDVEARVLRL
jgi:hypothetical protein